MSLCSYCGRDNEAGAQFCADCGKPLSKAAAFERAARAVSGEAGARVSGAAVRDVPAPPAATSPGETCPFCGGETRPALPFCPQCGRRLTAPGSGPACPRCSTPLPPGARYCAVCGAPAATGTLWGRASAERRTDFRFALVLLDDAGREMQRFERSTVDTTIGREDGDVRFPEDPFLSPLHARLSWETQGLVVRDLGSRNGTWVFLQAPHRLVDGDLLLIGSQLIRFRRLGYPGPHTPEADATRRMGSLVPSADIASLSQLRSDGSVRDVLHLSPGRDVYVGRERGDWTFPYDPSMSAQHALIRSEDADFVVLDQNSRNGIALAARGDVVLGAGWRILVGDKLLRVEFPS
ncbi:MAG TPA: FHA domain-containing protein [Gemmatimonadales bacterium]|nr:FHA domain-containing protein [Gemmatimonadales bacterium]